MNWNPFKRIAALERELNGLKLSHNRLIERLDEMERDDMALARNLESSDAGLVRWLSALEIRPQDLSNPVTITRADVEKETKARLKRAAYARKYYANKRAEAAKAAAGGAK